MQNSNLLVIFLTGLITGGLTCLAVQGGLLATVITEREKERLDETQKNGHAKPILSFLGAKLLAYTILGFLLGWFGSLFQLSIKAQALLQFAVAIFMIGTALNLLNAHPFFRYFVIQPPKILTRLVRNQSKSKDVFAPAILGAFTVFIPCGTTQAMMALAIAAGNPFKGAAILFAFILGTSPLFFGLGYMATKLGDVYQRRFYKLAAFAIILLALFNIRNALVISGVTIGASRTETSVPANQDVTISIENSGYRPKVISIPAGKLITLHLKNKNAYTCAQAFTIPKLGIQRTVAPGESVTIQFMAPKKPTTLLFSCSMGMYRGTIKVI